MNISEKAIAKLLEVDKAIIYLLDRRCMLACMIKEEAEKKLTELHESFGYDTLCLLFTRKTIEAPLNDVIKQADKVIAQSKQMKEMLLNSQDSEDTTASKEQIIDAIRQGVQKAIDGTAE